MTKPASELKPGDKYDRDGVEVTILRDQEVKDDLFGRPTLHYWAARSDTGNEGYVLFGLEAEVRVK